MSIYISIYLYIYIYIYLSMFMSIFNCLYYHLFTNTDKTIRNSVDDVTGMECELINDNFWYRILINSNYELEIRSHVNINPSPLLSPIKPKRYPGINSQVPQRRWHVQIRHGNVDHWSSGVQASGSLRLQGWHRTRHDAHHECLDKVARLHGPGYLLHRFAECRVTEVNRFLFHKILITRIDHCIVNTVHCTVSL